MKKNTSKKYSIKHEYGKDEIRFGRWTEVEEKWFETALLRYKKDWRMIAWYLGTRNLKNLRSSCQKKVAKYKKLTKSADKSVNKNKYRKLLNILQPQADSSLKSECIKGGWQKDWSTNVYELSKRLQKALRCVILTRDHGEGWSIDEAKWLEKRATVPEMVLKKFEIRKREKKAVAKEQSSPSEESEELNIEQNYDSESKEAE